LEDFEGKYNAVVGGVFRQVLALKEGQKRRKTAAKVFRITRNDRVFLRLLGVDILGRV